MDTLYVKRYTEGNPAVCDTTLCQEKLLGSHTWQKVLGQTIPNLILLILHATIHLL